MKQPFPPQMEHAGREGRPQRPLSLEYGVDVMILDANLQKAPTERARTHQAALDLALALREAGMWSGESTRIRFWLQQISAYVYKHNASLHNC